MGIIADTYNLAESIMSKQTHVSLCEDRISELAEKIKNWVAEESMIDNERSGLDDVKKIAMFELLGCSVNYRYWYGRHNIRPQASNAAKMYRLLRESYVKTDLHIEENIREGYEESIDGFDEEDMYYFDIIHFFRQKLIDNRFPAIKERCYHLEQVVDNLDFISTFLNNILFNEEVDIEDQISLLAMNVPGFGEDLFLKRCLLFFIMMNRRCGLFSDQIHRLPVPTDYKLPRSLNHHGCILYKPELENKIKTEQLIPKESAEEIEIRAATMLACRELAEESGRTIAEIDEFLWMDKSADHIPFHLTITTDY